MTMLRIIAPWLLALSATAPAQTLPPEVLVTRSFIADLEFDWGRNGVYCATCNFGAGNARFTFTDINNILWVANIDPDTGAFDPANGHGTMADTDAAQADDFGNGPEWVNTAQGSKIAYMKYLPGREHTPANAGIAIASFDGVAWSGAFMDGGLQRYLPSGSLDVGDPNPRLVYQNSSGANFKAYFRYLNDPSSERALPGNKPICARTWVPGTQALVYTAPCLLRNSPEKPSQVYWYDAQTGVQEQVTSDAGSKLYAMAWRAPDFNGDFIVVTVRDRQTLLVYRRSAAGSGFAWTLVNTIPSPPDLPYVTSPDVFVHNGKSYIAVQLSASSQASDVRTTTQIAITAVAPGQSGIRLLTSDATAPRLRSDPEYYITSQGPYIYYNRYVPATGRSGVGLDGIWRVDTGLGPPQQPPGR